MMEYSASHLAAFEAYRSKGYRLDGLSETQLDALLEDKNFVHEIAKWRQKALERARARMTSAPLDLTADDLAVLATVSPQLETNAWEARRQAQMDLLHKHAKAVPAAAPETLDEFVKLHGRKSVTWAQLTKVLTNSDSVYVEAIKALKQRAATLEQRNEKLEARVLELEAQRAIDHVER